MTQCRDIKEIAQQIAELVEGKKELFISVSDRIWEFAETRYEEHRSAELAADELERQGFDVLRGAGAIPTAVTGSYGSGKPVIAILGEYDALFGLSQKKGEARKDPLTEGAGGHGCGHNLLGGGALAAAVAVREYMEKNNLPGTVRYYGCPAEEGGGGKVFMVRNGLFDDVDAALTWHPASINGVASESSLATSQVYFRFNGRSAHAANSPHLGRSALDAVELTNVGANYLREHLVSDARLHYAITNAGGNSPNVVQPEAEVLYKLRVPKTEQLEEMYERVCNIARGAALMTGTELEIRYDAGACEIVNNTTLEKLMHEVFDGLGVSVFDEAEERFAAEIRGTLTESEKRDQIPQELAGKHLADRLEPYVPKAGIWMASTDVGDVSWKVPTAQCRTACFALGTQLHTWQAVSQGATSIGHKGMLQAAKVLAATAVELLLQPERVEQAKAEHSRELAGRTYKCLIPEGMNPGPVKEK